MGVRNLTGYINNKSNEFLENFQLHDTPLVIDGDSAAYQLYSIHFNPKNCCFTGDYDRYANVIRTFFKLLQDSNVTPYVVMDGGYEERKMDTIVHRMEDRIKTANKVSNKDDSIVHYPLFIGETFLEIIAELQLKVIRCDYEGDRESAQIAKQLNCPVLSNDSDYFIFDVPCYIPMTNFDMDLKTDAVNSYNYVSCRAYKLDRFLSVTGLQKNMLPLFATLLGNDFIKRENFWNFVKKIGKNNYVPALINFLKNSKDEQSAIRNVLRMSQLSNSSIKKSITDSMKGYVISSEPNEYFDYFTSTENVANDDKMELYSSKYAVSRNVISLFLKFYRKALYPSCFISILLHDTYYIRPQVENCTYESSHMVSVEILEAIHNILKSSANKLRLYVRAKNCNKVIEYVVPKGKKLRNLEEIQSLSVADRKKILLEVLKIDEDFAKNRLEHFPESWHLYILAVIYLCRKSVLNFKFIVSLTLCKIVLTYIDKKLKIFTRSPTFQEDFKKEICTILINRNAQNVLLPNNIKEATNITYEDAMIAMKNLMPFFSKEQTHAFNRDIVHKLAQFQSCLMHLTFLNSLLNWPFEDVSFSKCFNGTFIYNAVRRIDNENFDDFLTKNSIEFLLENSSTVLNCLRLMIEKLNCI